MPFRTNQSDPYKELSEKISSLEEELEYHKKEKWDSIRRMFNNFLWHPLTMIVGGCSIFFAIVVGIVWMTTASPQELARRNAVSTPMARDYARTHMRTEPVDIYCNGSCHDDNFITRCELRTVGTTEPTVLCCDSINHTTSQKCIISDRFHSRGRGD